MRHRKKINSLGRKAAHRKETMSSMASALILHKRINTTVAKAKALRVYVEPLITRSKVDSTHSRRMVFSYLGNKYAVSELFREIAQKVADRPGGYTRILKTGFRKGDGAEMCFIELVDYNVAMLRTEEESQQKRTRRGRRRGKKEKVAEQAAPAEQVSATTEESLPAGDESVDTPEDSLTAEGEHATTAEDATPAEEVTTAEDVTKAEEEASPAGEEKEDQQKEVQAENKPEPATGETAEPQDPGQAEKDQQPDQDDAEAGKKDSK